MRTIWSGLIAGAVVVGVLLAVMGLFWIIALAPLLIFFGLAIAYGILSSDASIDRRKRVQLSRDAIRKQAVQESAGPRTDRSLNGR